MAEPTPQAWAAAVLRALGIHQTPGGVQALAGWARAEGGHWNNDAKYNPLNTTQDEPGAGNTGTQGNIKVYRDWQQGIDATVKTLRNGRYGGILSALAAGNPNAVASAIDKSPWGTHGALVYNAISGTPKAAGVQPFTSSGQSYAPPATRTTTKTVGAVDNSQGRKQLALSFLLGSPGPGGQQNTSDPVQLALAAQGLKDQPGQQVTTTSAYAPPGSRPSSGGGGYVNPFQGSLVAGGRVDEGVDPTIRGPIRAIGDAKVVNISHNFYKGQPYIVYQLQSGPHAGKYVYVSELVTPHVKVGQTVRAGDVVATGHGAIETGWAGGAQGGYMPLANRAQGGNYTEGKVTSHGQSFLRLLQSLGANAGPR